MTAEESGVTAPARPTYHDPSERKGHKAIRPDFDAEEKLFNEYRSDSMFGDMGLGMQTGMRGFGVTLHIPNKEDTEPKELIGKYNERGQWVDEDGNTYNGYFAIFVNTGYDCTHVFCADVKACNKTIIVIHGLIIAHYFKQPNKPSG